MSLELLTSVAQELISPQVLSPLSLPPTVCQVGPQAGSAYRPTERVCAKLLQSCSTLCDPVDCSPPVSSVHGILQARILEWGAIAFS